MYSTLLACQCNVSIEDRTGLHDGPLLTCTRPLAGQQFHFCIDNNVDGDITMVKSSLSF